MESIFSLYCILWQIPVIPFQKEERILLWFWVVKWRSSCQRGPGSRWKRHSQVSLASRPESRTPKTRTLESIMPNSSLKWPCLAPLHTGDTPHPHFSNRSNRRNIPYTFVSNEKKNNGETSFFFFFLQNFTLRNSVFNHTCCNGIFILKAAGDCIRNATSWVVSTWSFCRNLTIPDAFTQLSTYLQVWNFQNKKLEAKGSLSPGEKWHQWHLE